MTARTESKYPGQRQPRDFSVLHCLGLLGTAALLDLDPLDKLIDDRRPRCVLVPEAKGVVLQRELGELECLVPHVAVDALLPLGLEELLPPR